MGRSPRVDYPGAWFHVMNRGIARRTAFESGGGIACFLEKLQEAVERKEFLVHAFCVMTTHFHLLVESRGKLSEGMRRVENEYVRWFNRRNRRDGPLFRGRFAAKAVESLVYRRILVRYIDYNPVEAGIVRVPSAYPHGSAALQRAPPAWLCREWLREELDPWLRTGAPWHEAYRAAFEHPASRDESHIVMRATAEDAGRSDLDELVGAAPDVVRAWMARKARLADGSAPGAAVLGPRSVAEALRLARTREGPWRIASRRGPRDGWRIAWIGLLRDACAMSFGEIAEETATSLGTSHRDHREHRRLLLRSEDYAQRIARLAAAAVALCHRAS